MLEVGGCRLLDTDNFQSAVYLSPFIPTPRPFYVCWNWNKLNIWPTFFLGLLCLGLGLKSPCSSRLFSYYIFNPILSKVEGKPYFYLNTKGAIA